PRGDRGLSRRRGAHRRRGRSRAVPRHSQAWILGPGVRGASRRPRRSAWQGLQRRRPSAHARSRRHRTPCTPPHRARAARGGGAMMAARRLDSAPDMTGIRGRLSAGEPMSRHTSWRVGGPADWFFQPADRDDLCAFLARLPRDIPVMVLGLGSNLLVRDGGIRGVVVATHKALSAMRVVDGGLLYAEAGVACAQAARFANRSGLTGAEFLAGIPGCIGGALAMNAGAFGGETWSVVDSVDLVDRTGAARTVAADEFDTGYRFVALAPDHWF